MGVLDSLKFINTSWKEYEKNVCNIDCVLINNNRQHQKAFRQDNNSTYVFFEKVDIKVGDIFVDSRGRLNIARSISNTKEYEKDGKKYMVVDVTADQYENPTGIVKLFNDQSIRDSSNIVLSASGDIIVNGEINNNAKITLSVFNRIDVESAWEAIKNDLFNLYDYEKLKDLVKYIDELKQTSGNRKETKFTKFCAAAKNIAGPLGVFVGSVLSSFYNK